MVTTAEERLFFSNGIRLVFFAVSMATLVALLSSAHWFAELFSHFRFYYLLTQALLMLVFLHSARWALMVATIVLAIPNAWYVVPYLTPLAFAQPIAAEPAPGVEVIAVNLNYRNADYTAMHSYLRSVTPDVLVAAEMTDAWQRELRYLEDYYPHRIGEARPNPWGMIVYSRRPFVTAELLDLGVPDTVHARIVIESGGKPLEIFAVHLQSPTNRRRAENRNRQLADLARRVRASELPTLIVGDMNVTPFSPYFGRFLAEAGLADARRPSGFHFTWPAHPVPLWIPIDHALADPSVTVTQVRRGGETGSDHYPLEVAVANGTG